MMIPTRLQLDVHQLMREAVANAVPEYAAFGMPFLFASAGQAFKVLDRERTEVRFNSEWLEPLGSFGWIKLAAKYNVAQMMERRMFKERFEAAQERRILVALHGQHHRVIQFQCFDDLLRESRECVGLGAPARSRRSACG